MRKPLLKRSKRLASIAVSATLAACAGEPVEPPNTSVTSPEVRGLVSSIDGSIVQIQDEFDGVNYTFNPSERTITHSDGRILDLADDQNIATMNAFHGNVTADATIADVEELCTPENPCAEPSFAPVEAEPSRVMLRRVDEPTRTHRSASSRFGIRVTGQIPRQFKRSRKSGDITLMTGEMCGDLATALRDAGFSYRYNRVNFVRDGFWSATFVAVGAALRGDLPVGGAVAAKFLGDIVFNQEKRVSLTILGTLWNSYSCSNQQIRVGSFYQGGGGGGGGTPTLDCHYESWQISVDGGNSWSNITVQVCEFAMT